MQKDTPLYKITIDQDYSEDGQDLGIEQIAFTKNPAIKVKGIAFNSHVKPLAFADEVKMRIAAPALIPMDIYRSDEDGEYYVQFTEEEIAAIHSKFMFNLNNSNLFNLEHNKEVTVPAYILEAWIVEDPETDKSFKTFNTKVPKGSLFVVSQITDQLYFNELVKNDQIGYSIEGFLGLKLSEHKNKNNKLSMELPEGAQFLIEGKPYIVKDGQIIEDVAAPAEAQLEDAKPVEDAPVDEAKLAEEPKEDVKPVEEPAEEEKLAEAPVAPAETESPAIDETLILSVLQPKLDEIYQMIADLKAQEVVEEATELNPTEVKMSAIQKFTNVNKFLSK